MKELLSKISNHEVSFLSENECVWQEYLANGETGVKSVSEGKVRKYINNILKKLPTHGYQKSEVMS